MTIPLRAKRNHASCNGTTGSPVGTDGGADCAPEPFGPKIAYAPPAAARYQIGLYADFLTQVVRLEENGLRYLCLQHDVQFRNRQWQPDEDGTSLAREWLNRQAFTLSRDRNRSRDLTVNRSVLRELLSHLRDQGQPAERDVQAAIDRLGNLVKRRNELTHHREGVQKVGLARAFTGPKATSTAADQIVPHLRRLDERACGQPLPLSPYQSIHQLLNRLLQATQR